MKAFCLMPRSHQPSGVYQSKNLNIKHYINKSYDNLTLYVYKKYHRVYRIFTNKFQLYADECEDLDHCEKIIYALKKYGIEDKNNLFDKIKNGYIFAKYSLLDMGYSDIEAKNIESYLKSNDELDLDNV